MAVLRSLWVATLAAVFLAAGNGFALADPPPWAHGHQDQEKKGDSGPQVRSHGVVSGTIVGIDYGMASILVATPRGVVPVAVTPTTSIFRGPGFSSFADLGRGAHVTVDVSEVDGRLIAQIIRIH